MKPYLIFLLLALLVIPAAMAFGPATHEVISRRALLTAPDGQYKEIAQKHILDFLAGSEANDISVIFYFSSFNVSYQSTHNWDYCYSMLTTCAQDERDQAFALGCFAHLSADSVSHNVYVVRGLDKYKFLDESSLHPMMEEALDQYYYKNVPNLTGDVRDMLADYYHFEPLINCALGTDEIGGYKVHDLMTIHRNSLDDFYAKQYGGQSASAPFGTKIYVFWGMFQFVNKPMAKYILTIDDRANIEALAVERIQNSLAALPNRDVDPAGAASLRTANRVPLIIQLILSAVIALVAILFGWGKRWSLIVSGIFAIAAAYLMYFMGFLGLLFLAFLVWLVSWLFLGYYVYLKVRKKHVPKLVLFLAIYNLVIDAIVVWIMFL